MAAPTKPTSTSQNYSAKGDKYRGADGLWYPTLRRRKAGWLHVLQAHEAKKPQ